MSGLRVPEADVMWHDGELIGWRQAQVHMINQTLQYGWGVYEGIRVYQTPDGPAAFRLDAHMRRLKRSAAMYGMRIDRSAAELCAAALELVRANGSHPCYLRPLAFSPSGDIGVEPQPESLSVMIALWPLENFLGDGAAGAGVSACISSWTRIPPAALPAGAKVCGTYLSAMLARAEAVRQGCTEAILLNAAGYVTDACVENVFVVSDGHLRTPPLSDGPLAGITRGTIMTIAQDTGIRVDERSLTRSDLYTADEVFFTGTAAEVVPVVRLDGRPIAGGVPGELTVSLMAAFRRTVAGTDPRYGHWLTPVSASQEVPPSRR